MSLFAAIAILMIDVFKFGILNMTPKQRDEYSRSTMYDYSIRKFIGKENNLFKLQGHSSGGKRRTFVVSCEGYKSKRFVAAKFRFPYS